MNNPTTFKLGWKPDVPDFRDFKFAARAGLQAPLLLPNKVDLRQNCRPVYDQLNLGSCTANAIATALDYTHRKVAGSFFGPSRLFIYYNERVAEGTVREDSGAMLRTGIKSVTKQGACLERDLPYSVDKYRVKPNILRYRDALKFQAIEYQRLNNQNLEELKECLALNLPFVFGIAVYPSFYRAGINGIVPIPGLERLLGGHAMICVGFDENTRMFTVRNSWGVNWGDKGDCYIPYDYLTNLDLADDFWTIKSSE